MIDPVFTGACTALVTPFLNGKVNYPMMEQLIRRQIEAGIEAIVLCGTTGESPTLTDTEKIEIIRHKDLSITVKDFGRGIPVDCNVKEERFNWELVFCEL